MIILALIAFLAIRYVSSSCNTLNNCTGHGICEFSQCKCFDGWGSLTDITTYRAPDCSARTCPSGNSWATLPDRKGNGHYPRECSDKGICDRVTGLCKCFKGFTGPACNRFPCPNDCSGHGVC